MNEELAHEIRTVTFTPVRLREGYDMGEVDTLLDVLAAPVESGQAVRSRCDGARFTPVRGREGYDTGEVDAFLDRVVRESEGAAPGYGTGTSSPVPAAPVPPLPPLPTTSVGSAANVVQEQRGLLSRLFGRS